MKPFIMEVRDPSILQVLYTMVGLCITMVLGHFVNSMLLVLYMLEDLCIMEDLCFMEDQCLMEGLCTMKVLFIMTLITICQDPTLMSLVYRYDVFSFYLFNVKGVQNHIDLHTRMLFKDLIK